MASLVSQDELDEEKASRSIVVSNIPEKVSYKDVIIHFQKKGNGGGEVDSASLDPTDSSVVVVTFEQPKIVESAINKQQIIDGAQVKVQRYPAPVTIPEVFVEVQAMVNPYIFNSSHLGIDDLQFLRDEFGVHLRHSNSRNVDYLIGSFTQIKLCHRYFVQQLLAQQNNEPPTLTTSRDNDAIHDNSKEVINKSINLQTVPILLTFIFSVPKYSQQLQDIETRYKVKISEENDGKNVKIESRPDCIQKQFEEGCEKFIDLYQKVHGGPMLSKELVLQPGSGSDYRSVDEAVNEILEDAPVVIDKLSTKDTWQFYGEENDVKSAINDVCKLLCISNPMKTSSRKRAPQTSQNPTDGSKSHYSDTFEAMDQEFPRPQDLANSHATSPVDDTSSPSTGHGFKEVFETKKGFKLTVQLSDITEEQTDAIVNCNEEYLRWFSSGLPRLIVKKGGECISKEVEAQKSRRVVKPGEVFFTTAGELRCKKVIHIILWNGPKGKDSQKNLVQKSILGCLKDAQAKHIRSIAFPAVGAGKKAGMDLKNCATAMVNAVEKYMKESDPKKNAVRDIRFILFDPTAFNVFKQSMKRYSDSKVAYSITTDIQSRPTDMGRRNPSAGHKEDDIKKTHDNDKTDDQDDCAICLDKPSDPRTLSKCKHQFCKSCIEKAFEHSNKCPTCGMAYGVQTGNMPRGTMHSTTYSYIHLRGYERYGTIEINYHFPSGTQGPEHPNPGQRYSGTSRTAYLPDCPEGREVLGLLKRSFDARLTFTIGTSVTTGHQNTVTWNDIHHKTNQYGGATGFGYPDPGYLKRVKEELAAKGIS